MRISSSAKLGLLVTAILASGFGCELLAQVDRSQISGASGTGGVETTSSSSTTVASTTVTAGSTGGAGGSGGMTTTSSTGGSGGMSSASSASSASGTGGGTTCATPNDCPDPGNECLDRGCALGQCAPTPKAAGAVTVAQTVGDCLKSQCDGAGKSINVTDDSDLPVDGLECTNDVCTGGVPSNPPTAASTACGQGGTLFCDGAGKCVGCNAPSDCAGADTDCHTRTCTAGVCGVSNAALGAVVVAQTAGDCHKAQCDGAGAVQSVVDDTDLPPDNETCTQDVCTAGVPSNPPVAVGTACSEGAGTHCNGAGACVTCLVATDCPGVDTECHQRVCNLGACGTQNTAQGTPLSTQTSSDCQKAVCDGSGGTTTQADDTDVPNDNNACTTDVCTSGVPSHGTVANGVSCGGSLTCLNGTCAGCAQPSDCPGVDTECKTRSCTVGVCGFNFTASGFAVAAQTAGDCHKSQCDGAGNIASNIDNTDVPADDGQQCTSEICTAGVPSHPAAATNTACNQNGGSFCSAGGTCVACNAPAQCAGTDTECHTRTCNANACGVNNTAAGFVTAAQSAGDCHKNQCDGAGNIVNNVDNSDVPADDGQQCTSEICNAGAPSHPAVAVNTACSQNGGTFCSAAGSCVACNAAAQCPGTDTECHTRTCNGNACGVNNAAAGTATSAQTTGDCQKNQCDGAGNIVGGADNTDVPVDDGNQCTGEICTAGVPSHPNQPINTACNQGGGTFCNGAGTCISASCSDGTKNGNETAIDCGGGTCLACGLGKTCGGNADCLSGSCAAGVCVACVLAAQCPGTDTECHTRTCNANTCGVSNTAAGTATSAQTTGNCQKNQCDGAGNIVSAADNTDIPADDGNQCTGEICTAGVPSHPTQPVDTACSQGGGTVCSAGGSCVQCNAAAQCAGTDTECHTRTCNGNTCGVNNTAAGTATSAQTTGDCQKNQCDGVGNIVNGADNTDVPADDGNQCTSDVCTAGVPSHPNLVAGTACSQSGGTSCDGAGACVAPPAVVSTTPADGASNIAVTSTIAVTFTVAMNPATLTVQTSSGACTGSLQISTDSFATCLGVGTLTTSGGNTVATATPAPGLSYGSTYLVKVTAAAQSAVGVGCTPYTSTTGFTTVASTSVCGGGVVISQVYGGGGNAGSIYKNDFIELHNNGATAVSLAGWSVQYTSATGTTWTAANTTNLTGTIQPGAYYLIQEAIGAGGTTALPTPDATGTIAMAGGAGKVALVSNTTLLTGVCPTGGAIVDFVGYGTTANCFEGTAATPAPGNTTSVTRAGAGCTDTNQNATDFTAGAVVPHNSAATAGVCACTINESSPVIATEADYCVLQSPTSLSVQTGTSSGLIYGRLFETGVTPPAGASSWVAQVGYGPDNVNPENQSGWQWFSTTWNAQFGNNDEYQGSFTAPAAGQYRYTYRFSSDGLNWTYCDVNGAGSNGGLTFETTQLPIITVTP